MVAGNLSFCAHATIVYHMDKDCEVKILIAFVRLAVLLSTKIGCTLFRLPVYFWFCASCVWRVSVSFRRLALVNGERKHTHTLKHNNSLKFNFDECTRTENIVHTKYGASTNAKDECEKGKTTNHSANSTFFRKPNGFPMLSKANTKKFGTKIDTQRLDDEKLRMRCNG